MSNSAKSRTHPFRKAVWATLAMILVVVGVALLGWGTRWTVRPTGEATAGYELAMDSTGFIHVADSGNHRVVMLSPKGEFLAEWKIPEAAPEIHSPEKIAVAPDGRTVYATDLAANRILVLNVVTKEAPRK